MDKELEQKIDFLKIQEKMNWFHIKSDGKMPNLLIVPAQLAIYQKEKIEEVFGMKVIFGTVQEPIVTMMIK